MKHWIVTWMLIGLGAAPALADTRLGTKEAAMLQDGLIVTAESFILPSYQTLATSATELVDKLEAYCDAKAPIDAARTAFGASFLAWQRASIIQVGPIMDAEGPMRFQLWPDPKGFSRRTVQRTIKKQDPQLIQPDGLVDRSIALVNQTALEELLFSDLQPNSYACDLGVAIGRFQSNLAQDIVDAWTQGSDFREDYDNAVKGNERYPSVDALIRELLAGAVVYKDRLRRFKIQRGLGAHPGDERAARTEAEKSGLGLKSIEAGFRAFADFYMVENGFFDKTTELNAMAEHRALGQLAINIADKLAAESRTLPEIMESDPALTAKIRGYGDLVSLHEDYLKVTLPGSIGLTTGFTSADGD